MQVAREYPVHDLCSGGQLQKVSSGLLTGFRETARGRVFTEGCDEELLLAEALLLSSHTYGSSALGRTGEGRRGRTERRGGEVRITGGGVGFGQS